MLAAFGVSAAFLVCYVIYHAHVGSRKFAGTGSIRPVYYTLLVSHIILAAIELPLILTTLVLALRGNLAWHRKIARPTLCVWLYVSVTGVVIYLMLYQVYGFVEPTT